MVSNSLRKREKELGVGFAKVESQRDKETRPNIIEQLKSSEEALGSNSSWNKRPIVITGDKELRRRRKREKTKMCLEGIEMCLVRSVRRKLLKGLSASQMEVGDQPRYEP